MTPRDPHSLLPLTPALVHVLGALADGETHGYAIMKEVARLTDGAVRLSTGTLYGIIKRLLSEGVIREGTTPGDDAARPRSRAPALVRPHAVGPRRRTRRSRTPRAYARDRPAQDAVQTGVAGHAV